MTQYYSFFTVDDSGSRTYYYFIPAATESGTTQKGAGGIYVTADGKQAASLSSTSERYYFNRTFNKDANVTGTDKNTGTLVGSMTTTAGIQLRLCHRFGLQRRYDNRQRYSGHRRIGGLKGCGLSHQ